MQRRSKSRLSVLLIDPQSGRARRRVASLDQQAAISILDSVATLNQAYNLAEAERPDLVLVSSDQPGRIEFPMFAAMLEILRIDLVALHDGLRSHGFEGQIACVSEAEVEAAGGLGPWASKIYRLPTETTASTSRSTPERSVPPGPDSDRARSWKTVVIGSSTGGVEALTEVLSHFGADCPPTLVVQHIRAAYVPGLANRLNAVCGAEVEVASSTLELRPGHVMIAPGDSQHLTLHPSGRWCRLVSGSPVSGHRPSVDMLFKSAARQGTGTVGVLLTGMGRDGADGLAAIRQAGGWTIGQDEASAIVYGMPKVAWEMGAVQEQLDLRRIGPATLKAASQKGAYNHAQ